MASQTVPRTAARWLKLTDELEKETVGRGTKRVPARHVWVNGVVDDDEGAEFVSKGG